MEGGKKDEARRQQNWITKPNGIGDRCQRAGYEFFSSVFVDLTWKSYLFEMKA